jgi:hypothetical protein
VTIMTTALRGASRPPATGNGTDPQPPRLELASSPHEGPLAGAWWPRSRRPAAELNALVSALAARGVIATRLSLSVTGWDRTPGRLRLADRDVPLIWFAYRTPHTVIVGHGAEEITLLVVPPETTATSAAQAIRLASTPRNRSGPEEILAASGATSHLAKA